MRERIDAPLARATTIQAAYRGHRERLLLWAAQTAFDELDQRISKKCSIQGLLTNSAITLIR